MCKVNWCFSSHLDILTFKVIVKFAFLGKK